MNTEIDRRRARLFPQGARPRIPSRQDASPRHQQRFRIRFCTTSRTTSSPRSRRRGVARGASKRSTRLPPRRDARGRPAADLQPLVRQRAVLRSRRPVDHRVQARLERESSDEAMQAALQRLRDARAPRFERSKGRRRRSRRYGGPRSGAARDAGAPTTASRLSIELGAKANPPGFDEQLLGLEPGATRRSHPYRRTTDWGARGPDVAYTVTVKG